MCKSCTGRLISPCTSNIALLYKLEFDEGGYADEEIAMLFFDTCFIFVLSACQNKVEPEYHVSNFDGEKLYIECNGNTLVYERHQPGIGTLTKKTRLDMFETNTAIEGIAWGVWSTEEHPDLSYILLISGTNSSWTFRISEQTP